MPDSFLCRAVARGVVVVVALVAVCAPARAVVYGLDVYAGNGTMNWPLIAGGGKDFAWVKGTEGVGFEDANTGINLAGAKAAGMYVGAYDFAHPESNTPVAEADYFINYIKGISNPAKNSVNGFGPGFLVPSLDLETGAGAHVGATSLDAWANAWCAEVFAKTGVHPVVYTYPNFAQTYLTSAVTVNKLWIASYDHTDPASNPSVTGPWNGAYEFWQYTSTGRLPGGPSGNVDLDVYKGTLAQLVSNYVIPAGAAPDGGVVPEPPGLVLLGIGGVVLGRRRRTKTGGLTRIDEGTKGHKGIPLGF